MSETVETPATTLSPASGRWTEVIGAFAKAINRLLPAVESTLLDRAVESRDDAALGVLSRTNASSFITWFTAEPIKAKEPMILSAVEDLHRTLRPAPVTEAVNRPNPGASNQATLLDIPTDLDALSNLIIGSALAEGIEARDAVAAIEVDIADSAGIYNIPRNMIRLMEDYCDRQDLPVTNPGAIMRLLRDLRRRRVADVFDGFDDGDTDTINIAVSDEKRKLIRNRMKLHFWPALRAHWEAVHTWSETNRIAGIDMASVMNMMRAFAAGDPSIARESIATADLSPVRDATNDLLHATNKLFGGFYAYLTIRALAVEALTFSGYLKTTSPIYKGVVEHTHVKTRDELLKASGAAVTDNSVRTKLALQRYVFNAFQIPNKSDPELVMFASELHIHGRSISWNNIGQNGAPTSSNAPLVGKVEPNWRPYDEKLDRGK